MGGKKNGFMGLIVKDYIFARIDDAIEDEASKEDEHEHDHDHENCHNPDHDHHHHNHDHDHKHGNLTKF